MRKTKVLIVTNPSSAATDWYRTVTPYRILAEQTGAIELFTQEPEKLRWYHIDQCDVVIFSRPNGSSMLGFVAEAALMGKHVIGDFDDDLFGLNDFNPASKHFMRPEIKATVENTFRWFTWVTVSTNTLKNLYANFFPAERITIIPNAYNPHFIPFQEIKPESNPINVLWRGSETHLLDMFTVAPVLNMIIADPKIDFTVYGLPKHVLPWLRPGYKHFEWNTLFRYFKFIIDLKPDWIIVPLVPDRFNEAKSNIAGLETFISGGACLAPPLEEWIRPGIINYHSIEELATIMGDISAGRLKKAEYVKEGQEWFRDYCSLDQTNMARVDVLNKVMATQPFFYRTRENEYQAQAKPKDDGKIVTMAQARTARQKGKGHRPPQKK